MNITTPHTQVVAVAYRTMAKIILNRLSSEDHDALHSDDGLVVDGVAVWWHPSGYRLYAFASDKHALVGASDLDRGTLYDYCAGDKIRPATMMQFAESYLAAHDDGGRGVIDVNGRSCYVV